MSFFEDEETRSDDEEEQLTAAPERRKKKKKKKKNHPKRMGGRRTTTINKGDQFPALRIPADRPNGGNRNTPPIVNDGYSGDNFMEITTVSGVNIKKAVDSVITLLTSASLQFGSDGVRILGKDIGGAAISSIFFKRSAFQLYHCQQPVKFGLDIVEFNKLSLHREPMSHSSPLFWTKPTQTSRSRCQERPFNSFPGSSRWTWRTETWMIYRTMNTTLSSRCLPRSSTTPSSISTS